jgi:hypothetical protein
MRLSLGLLIVILAAALALQWLGWPREPATPAVPGPQELPQLPDQPAVALDDDRTRDEYLSVSERPLFLPDRRPPDDEPEVAVGPEEEVAEELTGLDINAILINRPDPASVWLVDARQRNTLIRKRLGESYQGWLITAIEPDRVKFERQGETKTLDLLDYDATPVGPARPAPRRNVRRTPAPVSQQTPPAPPRPGADDDR